MSELIPAIFESGVLRPLVPLELHEGEIVNLRIATEAAHADASESAAREQRAAIDSLLAEATALPPEGIDDAFSGRDHDSVLYGQS